MVNSDLFLAKAILTILRHLILLVQKISGPPLLSDFQSIGNKFYTSSLSCQYFLILDFLWRMKTVLPAPPPHTHTRMCMCVCVRNLRMLISILRILSVSTTLDFVTWRVSSFFTRSSAHSWFQWLTPILNAYTLCRTLPSVWHCLSFRGPGGRSPFVSNCTSWGPVHLVDADFL